MLKVLYILVFCCFVSAEDIQREMNDSAATNSNSNSIVVNSHQSQSYSHSDKKNELSDKDVVEIPNVPLVVITFAPATTKEKVIAYSENPNIDLKYFDQPDEDMDEGEIVKYYYFVLVGFSVFVIGLISYRSMRLRRSRAESKYGHQNDKSEIEPLESNKFWVDDDTDDEDNEDSLFDINQLKNSRSQIFA